MNVIVSEVDKFRRKTFCTDVAQIKIAEWSKEGIRIAVQSVSGFGNRHMDEATITIGKRVAVVSWHGADFYYVRDAAMPWKN